MKIFTGSYRDADGQQRVFRLDADDFDHAESLLEDLRASAAIDGELVDEGEVEMAFSQVGRA